MKHMVNRLSQNVLNCRPIFINSVLKFCNGMKLEHETFRVQNYYHLPVIFSLSKGFYTFVLKPFRNLPKSMQFIVS